MTDDDTEVTKTGIVRKRNENGYIIHPDRHDTHIIVRLWGITLLIAALATFAFGGGFRTLLVTLPTSLFGLVLLGWAWRRRRRVGGYRT